MIDGGAGLLIFTNPHAIPLHQFIQFNLSNSNHRP
jgi:hypothetical protein